jgi:hypothetical protein
MSRTSKSVNGVKSQSTARENAPQPTLTDDRDALNHVSANGHATNGKDASGNSVRPRNTHARECARMLQVFCSCMSEQEMVRVFRKLYELAEAGDTKAAKIIVEYRYQGKAGKSVV